MALNVSKELAAKLQTVGDVPILDSIFGQNQDGTHYERVLGRSGMYVSSEADGWQLRGPFPVGE